MALLALGGLLGGCSDDGGDEGASESSTTEATADFNDADVEFVQGMIPHHEGAVTMAEMAAEQASSPQVKDLAARIAENDPPSLQGV